MSQFFLRFDQVATYPAVTRQYYLSMRSWLFCLAGIIDYASCLKGSDKLTSRIDDNQA